MTTAEAIARRCRVYLAAPLFSEAEREFNARLACLLEDAVEVYLPQRDGGLVSDMVAQGVRADSAVLWVFQRDMQAIRESDYFLAVLDGRAIDEGVAFELGVAFCHSKRCIGLQTDSRRLANWGNNPMITGALEVIFTRVDDLAEWLRENLSQRHHRGAAAPTSDCLTARAHARV